MAIRKVFVSGCFDLFHAGHAEFLKRAATYGELYVSIGSDRTISHLKHKLPVYSERERKFILESLQCVHQVLVGSGHGTIDFLKELMAVRPDVFVVNTDGDCEEKRELCRQQNIDYVVLDRSPAADLPARSSTEIQGGANMPYRIDLAGGWLDQPWVSKLAPGPVVTLSLEPNHAFSLRAGMATSTRARAMRLWGNEIPPGDPEELAQMLFCFENPPGKLEISGSQDSLGIVMPGLNRLDYDSEYWPRQIDNVVDEDILAWLDKHLRLLFLYPRPDDFSVLAETNVTAVQSRRLARYAQRVWESILARDPERMGHYMSAAFQMQISMFPNMITPEIEQEIDRHLDRTWGIKISGAGGGGYLVLLTDQEIEGTLRLSSRRPHNYSTAIEPSRRRNAA